MATKRRLPDVHQICDFLPGMPKLPSRRDAVNRAADVSDLRLMARRRAPRMVFDYVDGSAETERSAQRMRDAFDRVGFRPRVLRDVATVDTTTTLFDRTIEMPLVLAPTGFTRMMHHEGEQAVAAAAGRAGVPYTLSTMGTTTASDVVSAAPDGWNWFQLYVFKQRAMAEERMALAREAGMDVLVVTVDTAVAGNRLRDVRHGMTIPPTLRWSAIPEVALHPAWWMNFLSTEPLAFATVGGDANNIESFASSFLDPSVTFDDLEWMRQHWDGTLVIKGVQDVSDAKRLADLGVDGIMISCHGGRQLDRAPVPLEELPAMREAVGDRMQLIVDGGVRSGADVAAAVALGADACSIGRPYLYGLMAGGEYGVDKVLDLFKAEYVRTLQLLGTTSTAELGPEAVTLRER